MLHSATPWKNSSSVRERLRAAPESRWRSVWTSCPAQCPIRLIPPMMRRQRSDVWRLMRPMIVPQLRPDVCDHERVVGCRCE